MPHTDGDEPCELCGTHVPVRYLLDCDLRTKELEIAERLRNPDKSKYSDIMTCAKCWYGQVHQLDKDDIVDALCERVLGMREAEESAEKWEYDCGEAKEEVESLQVEVRDAETTITDLEGQVEESNSERREALDDVAEMEEKLHTALEDLGEMEESLSVLQVPAGGEEEEHY